MAFTDSQVRQLKAKLDPKHVKTRNANGANLTMSRDGTSSPRPTASSASMPGTGERLQATACGAEQSGAYHGAAYTAKVRVSVRAGDITIVREGSGTGEGRAPTPGQAHELALKGAETDATKRALATFGNPFGLALYDREQAGVRKSARCLPLLRRNFARLVPGCCAQAPASLSQATTPQSPSSKL